MDNFVPHGDGHPALTDVTVRRAIRMAINSQELVDRVLLGYGIPGDTIIPPVSVAGARYEPPSDVALEWDLDAAAQSLEDAGYVDTDGDGVREMPAGSLEPGRPLEFRYYVRTNEQTSVDAAPFVSEWLEQIGISTEVIAVTSNRLGDIINEGDVRHVQLGLVSRSRSGLGARMVPVRPAATRRDGVWQQRRLLLQPGIRPPLPRAAGGADLRGAVGDRPRDAADLLRGRRLRGHVVRPPAAGVPDGSVHGLQPPASARRRPPRGVGRPE